MMSRFPQYSASERSCQSQIVGNGTSDLPLRLQQVREQVRRVPSDKALFRVYKSELETPLRNPKPQTPKPCLPKADLAGLAVRRLLLGGSWDVVT